MNRIEMTMDWSLRDEILTAAHRWPLIMIFCLAGAAAGALAALLWPSPYRASRELYVGLNVTQAGEDRSASQQSGLVFVNANDYKNWQMASLNTMVFMDEILDGTLEQLQRVNPYWDSVSRTELAEMLSVYWRNAGKWRLVAEHPEQDRAIEAVVAWQDVIVAYVHNAVAQANQALSLDGQLRPLAEQVAQAQAALAGIETDPAARLAAQNRLEALEQEYQDLSAQFTTASQASLGLAAELLVQKLSRTRVDVTIVRPFGISMLVGLGLGLIAWAGWFLLTASRRVYKNASPGEA